MLGKSVLCWGRTGPHKGHSVNEARANRANNSYRHAKDRGAFVSISAEDVGRADVSFLQEYAGRVHSAGADRLRLSDSIGILTPDGYAQRVDAARRACPIDVQCHTHNDFGLAVANTLAGLHAGARYFHCTVNGMSERAGLPDLAQMAMMLRQLYKIDVGVEPTCLIGLSQFVAHATGHEPLPWQPLVGRNVFAHESGIHVRAMLQDPSTFEPFDPKEMGSSRSFVLGKHTGRASVMFALQQQGVQPDPERVAQLVGRVRDRSIHEQKPLTPRELVELYEQMTTAGI